jgi:nucleotide-binding universal stress UspA family protein
MSARTAICPVDFSDHSRQALQYASALTAYVGGRLVVVHVVDPLLAAAQETYQWDPAGADAREELTRFVTPEIEAQGLSPANVELVLAQGHAASEILALAAKHRAELVVMGTHGLSGFRRMFFGSTTGRVLRQAHLPVLVVPLGQEGVRVEGPRRLTGALIAPVDFSAASLGAAGISARLARTFSLPLVLLHVVSPLRVSPRYQAEAAAHDAGRMEKARESLQQVAADIGATDTETLVTAGDPAEEIARVAGERHAGMIVMGLQGEGLPLVGRAPGSVASRVLSLSPVPVLAVPSTERA